MFHTKIFSEVNTPDYHHLPKPALKPETVVDVLDQAPPTVEHQPGDCRDKGGEGEAVVIELTEEKDEAGDVAAEDADHVGSEPGDKEIRSFLLDSSDTKTVAEKEDAEAEHLADEEGDVLEPLLLAGGAGLLGFQPGRGQADQGIKQPDDIEDYEDGEHGEDCPHLSLAGEEGPARHSLVI